MAYTGPSMVTGSAGGRPFLSNVEMLGGLVSGSTGEYVSLPVSSSDLNGRSAVGDAISATAASFTTAVLSSSFLGSSGSIIQSMNYLKSQIDAVSSGADFDASGSKGATQSMVLASETFAFATGSNGGIGVELFDTDAGGGVKVSASFSELADASIENGDSIAFVDANDGNITKREAIADVASLFAGAGMTATNSEMNVIAGANGGIAVAANDISLDMDELTAITAVVSGDSLGIVQQAEAADPTKKITVDKLVEAIAGTASSTGLADDTITLKVSITGLGAETTVADSQVIAIDTGDDGTLKKMTRGNLLGSAKAIFTTGVSIADEFKATANLSSSAAGLNQFLGALQANGAMASSGSITGAGDITSTGGAVQASTTVSAGGAITAGTNVQAGAAGAHSYVSGTELRLHGTNAAGTNKSFALSVSGGMLQVQSLE